MVSAVSLIGAAFAVGGSYFAVDTLRDVLIAKTITMPYATRMAIASAAAFGGLLVISNIAAQDARKQTKQNLGKQLMGAEEDDPNYMVKSDIHKIAESGIKMNVLMDEFPEADLPIWWKSKISVTASQADDLADNLGYVLADPEAFDAEGYDHRKDGSWSRMVADTPTDTVMHQVDIFHDSFITDVDEAHRAAQRWLRKNENDRFDQIHYIIDMIDTGKWGMEYIALDTMDAEELTFHDWSDQEMMTHGKDDSFEDWVEHEIDSHGNLTLRDWADDEEESHIQRYGADTKVRRHSLDRFTKQRKPSGDSFRRKGRRSALRSMMAAEDDTVYMIETEYHSWDNWQNDCIAYDSFGPYATEAGAKRALTKMMKDAAEDWTNHSSLQDPETGEPMFTFGLDRDEYGNVEIKPSGMSLSDFTFKHTKTEHKGGRDFDGMTYSGHVVPKQVKAADSDDDDDDSSLVPDREPRRGAPDLWFAEDKPRRFTPQEALKYLQSGDNCVWLIDYSDYNYGDDEYPHYDYPIEDPDELETMILEGAFEKGSPYYGTVIANDTSYALGMWKDQPGGKHPSYADRLEQWDESSDSRSRGPFTDKDAEESVVAGTNFTCDCGASCVVDADTEIAYGPGGYDLRCGRNDDCRGDEKVLGAEVFEAFSLSDRPVSVKFGPGTSGNAKMKATFTDASGDTKTTQFGYKGMSDFTKHKDEGRRDSYLARHGSKGQNQNWKDPTTAGALSRYVLWEKTSLPAAKSAFKKRFNLRAEETHARYSVADLGYQESIFLTDPGRRAVWDYETDYSVEDAE